ncbi:MAG TPA: transposase [Marinobacter sp.]|uniref:Transposase n=1 Tax=Marinobacter antarcticus TaxID=564117 RepID=A0A831R3C8_9GAMM|nr:transposase [Marinobacter antarcticus]HDZ37220.1 transposase [Marinobacter sp.]HEA53362.1 transposase [Marinobacter antarcticus]
MNNVSVTRPYRKRRRHSPEFKARLVAECHSPGASVSRIALDNDLNANQLRRWIRESKQVEGSLPIRIAPSESRFHEPAARLSWSGPPIKVSSARRFYAN